MSFDTCKDVWVFIESFQGQPKSVGLELLGQGRKLADGLKQKLCAIVIGKDVDAAIKESAAYGADKIYVIQGDEYENYSADAYGNVFLKLCEKYDPNTILVGATVNGRDLGSKIAVSLRTGLTADCTALSVDEDTGNVVWSVRHSAETYTRRFSAARPDRRWVPAVRARSRSRSATRTISRRSSKRIFIPRRARSAPKCLISSRHVRTTICVSMRQMSLYPAAAA